MSKRIILTIDKREAETLNFLLARYGGKAPAYFRYLLKAAYEKEFGGYKSGKITGIVKNLNSKIELTDEQYCEKVGGKSVKGEDGLLKCRLDRIGGGSYYNVPIENRELIKFRAKELKLI